ncbi:hypothetical protein [Pseudonocardia sp. KRD291]|uniref:hypothetical protein n=1 Tax=Pseudonocardia sp. KRD291 TaxID=2792007 RepID=UPI001C4A62C0|nr:hypothetical protein [Pseudonocardia sp. KRD291]MBW0102946.1 hypothetical protein [Pseudonocardia sp. KRD291]
MSTETLFRTEHDARIANDIRLDIADGADGTAIPFRALPEDWASAGPITCSGASASYGQQEPPF